MNKLESVNQDILFIDDSDETELLAEVTYEPWQILIVDDDPEVHSVTQLALSDLIVLDRRLEYLHAFSAKEACQLVKDNQDIAMVLLDVVMETDDAGLQVVKYVREELKRKNVRIVLRTGQPGYAPEESVIKQYDINDYKTKTELTRRKLVTSVFAAIRAYQQLSTVSNNSLGLEQIVEGVSTLSAQHSLSAYCKSVLTQFRTLINDHISAVFCAKKQADVGDANDLNFYILAQTGFSISSLNQKLTSLNNEEINEQVNTCFIEKQHSYQNNNLTFYLAQDNYIAVIYIAFITPLLDSQIQLLNVLLTGVTMGYANIHLFEKLNNEAYKDHLTDLPNRLDFVRALDSFALTKTQNDVAVLVDIDHFSDINDALGQEVGNQLLIAVAERLLIVEQPCQFARVGADVFGIIGPAHYLSPKYLSMLFDEPFWVGEQCLSINACFGLCLQTFADNTGKKVLNQISIALNLAKKNRVQAFVYYDPESENQMQWRLSMIRQLRIDFGNDGLELWYQPQLNLSTGKVIGAEALLRWRLADGNFVSPAVFIPLAEHSGLIIDIGHWVIEQACQQLKKLENDFANISISVNVSIAQFRRNNFVDKTISTIQAYEIQPKKLELEITENILMDDPQIVIDGLLKLKEQGMSIALDDFGTGYSSLSYLQNLPLDRLKVDRAFVANITEEGQSVIAETIINLGQKMQLKVTAEGIEDIDQHQRLIALGCDEVQGFYYAKPMPEDKFLAFLAEHA